MATKKTVFLTAAQILAADDLEAEEVATPEWGGVVLVSALSGTDRSAYINSMVTMKHTKGQKGGDVPEMTPNLKDADVKLCVLSIINNREERVRLFTDKEIGVLGAKSSAPIGRVAKVANRLSRLGEEAVKDAAKN